MDISTESLYLSLDIAEKELRYTTTKNAIELLGKDENLRRLRAELFLAEDDTEELRDQLQHEQDSSDRSRQLADEHLLRAQQAEDELTRDAQVLRKNKHEIECLQAELESLRSSTQDTTTILAEKLALARELSILKPELDHLKAQEGVAERLRIEKTSLQRQLLDTQCEVETARADLKRAQAKRRNTTVEIAQEEQVSELKRELARERRSRKNAEEAAEQAQHDMDADDLRRELAKEKRQREKLEQELELLQENTQVEDIRRDLCKAQKARHRLQEEIEALRTQLEQERRSDARDGADGDLNTIRAELALEQQLRTEQSKDGACKEEQMAQEKGVLEDKLNQFRTKLREKKEELKIAKEELVTMKEQLDKAEASNTAGVAVKASKVAKTAIQPAAKVPAKKTKIMPDTTLGTPGDKPTRTRQVKAAAIGDKSSFSITPFLNKTAVIEEGEQSDAEPSPSHKIPLAPAASIKSNQQAKGRHDEKALDVVTEVEEPASQHPPKKKKPRKSLVDFKSFQKEDEPVKQKKRRLGLAPTLFDEDDDGTKGGKSLFGAAAYAKIASTKRGSALGRSTLITAADGSGFQFSPLKRSRRNMDTTLMG